MTDLDELLAGVRKVARSGMLPVDRDREVYAAFGKDPDDPVLFAGTFEARVCCFGRELGRDEVRFGQPQVGASGRAVRRGVLDAAGVTPEQDDILLEAALEYVFLTNTVPYKPPGNQAYPEWVKGCFRPYVARLLACYWKGAVVITLGTEAFRWFVPYAAPGSTVALWSRWDKYEAELPVILAAKHHGKIVRRELTVCPLPHPSPLNRKWLHDFPELLRKRLEKSL